jgi:hypothetical protein
MRKKFEGWRPEWLEGRVVNRRETDKYDVLVCRPSKWGNPFSVEDYGRDRAILLYEVHLRRRPDLIAALPELAGKILGCVCCPLPCHAAVLLRLLWEYHGLR